jgi:hypothetical protein
VRFRPALPAQAGCQAHAADALMARDQL